MKAGLRALRANGRAARRSWRQGRAYGYPLCCVLHFSWDELVGYPSGTARAYEIDHPQENEWPYVPCGVVHAGESRLPLRKRVLGILSLQWQQLRPGTGSRAYRRLTGYGLFTERRRYLTDGDGPAWLDDEHEFLESDLQWE